jgi:hypothetical protein
MGRKGEITLASKHLHGQVCAYMFILCFLTALRYAQSSTCLCCLEMLTPLQ